jgi:hypothetical protein
MREWDYATEPQLLAVKGQTGFVRVPLGAKTTKTA